MDLYNQGRTNMRPHRPAITLVALVADKDVAAPPGTAFTHQGCLTVGGNPANGIYDFRFPIFDLASGGSAVAGLLTNAAVGMSNGLFAVAGPRPATLPPYQTKRRQPAVHQAVAVRKQVLSAEKTMSN